MKKIKFLLKSNYLLLSSGFLVFSLFLFSSCEKNNNSNDSADFEMHMAKLQKLGITTDIVDEYEDYYIVECDMKFTKEFLDEVDTETDESNSKLKQAHIGSSFKISAENRFIRVFLDDNFGSLDLSDEVNTVISAYNSIGSPLVFSRVNTAAEANLILTQGNLPTGFCALSSFPINGLPGNDITFDEGEIGGLSHNQNVFLIAHEIGHAIGLRHTNWDQTVQYCTGPESQNVAHPDDPSQTISAVQIAGTPTSDASSVFNKCTCGYSWTTGFSNYDKTAIKNYYAFPQPPTNLSIHDFGNSLVILWTASTSNVSGYSIQQVQPISRSLGTTTSTSFAVQSYLLNGTNVFAVSAYDGYGNSSGVSLGYYYQYPAPPTNVSYHQFGPAHVVIWTTPTGTITGYVLKQHTPVSRTAGTAAATATSFYLNPYLISGMNVFSVCSTDKFGNLSSGGTVGLYFP